MTDNNSYLVFTTQDGEDPKVAKRQRRAQRILRLRVTMMLAGPLLLLTGSAFAAGLVYDTYPLMVLIPLGFVLMTMNTGGPA